MPTCPPYYVCTFTPQKAHVVTRYVGSWWHRSGGLVVILAIVVAVFLIVVACLLSDHLKQRAIDKRQTEGLKLEREHTLAIEEQRTMQADMCKGDIEMLRILRSR